MRNHLVTFLALLIALCLSGCAMNGGHSKVKTATVTVALDVDGHAITDRKGNPVMNETNFYASVSMKQAAAAAASAIKDFTYGRTNSSLGDASVSLSGATQDSKVDPELVTAITDSLMDRLVPDASPGGVAGPTP